MLPNRASAAHCVSVVEAAAGRPLVPSACPSRAHSVPNRFVASATTGELNTEAGSGETALSGLVTLSKSDTVRNASRSPKRSTEKEAVDATPLTCGICGGDGIRTHGLFDATEAHTRVS